MYRDLELTDFFKNILVKIVAGNAGDNAMKNKIWGSITRRLNEVEGGVLKSSLKWAKSWADMKVYAKSRAKMAINGTAPLTAKRPTEIDKRILTVIGQEELLLGWENAIADESNSSTSRQLPPEHDYELTGFQEVDESVDINFLDETEERLENDDYTDQPSQQHSGHKRPKQEVIRDIRQAINRFSDGDLMETMEFYIDDDHAEEVHIMEPQPEYVAVDDSPKPKKIKREHPVSRIQPSQSNVKKDKQDDQYVQAMTHLADALNNVAGALYTISETVRNIKR